VRREVLPEATATLLGKIQPTDLPEGTYLAGGTAIALWLGHRQSVDLDWFTPARFNEQAWLQKWEELFNFTLTTRDWQTLEGQAEGVKLAIYYYKYPIIGKLGEYNQAKVAGLEDLSAMKLDAVTSRGTKRDFIDLYFLARKYGLNHLFQYYDLKYGAWEERQLLVKKALIYFEEADEDEMPQMLVPIHWDQIKRYFIQAVV